VVLQPRTRLPSFLYDRFAGILSRRGVKVKRRRAPEEILHIDIVADIACPWCYIGKRRLERALALRPSIVATRSWLAFQLNPDMPADGISREFYLGAKFGNPRQAVLSYTAIAAAGRGAGIEFAFDRIRRTPNTLNAHRLIRLAATEGSGDAMVEALFRAYFSDGIDIGDVDTLAAIAARTGLDLDATRSYLAGEDGAVEVLAEEGRARRLGIHAVPCFVLDRGYTIAGAYEPEMFLPLFDIAAGIGNRATAER
jgi:predicted DsbA family dithiol-disulfide isomerase